jgi:hypothetical protein
MITPRKVQPVVISLDFGTSQNIHTQTRIHTHKYKQEYTHTNTHTSAKTQKSQVMHVMRVSSQGFLNNSKKTLKSKIVS